MKKNLLNVKNKIILIFGGSSGIGLKIGLELKKLNAKVIFIGRKKKSSSDYYRCSVEKPDELKKTFKKIYLKYGKIDGIINSVGYTEPSKKNILQSPETFKKTIKINLISAFEIIFYGQNYLRNGSSIINISSIGSQLGFPCNPGYLSSKAGLDGLTKALAYDLSYRKIRVNNILPGYIKTKMTKKSYNNKNSFLLRKSRTLLDRWGKTEDVAGAAVYLISDGSKYTTGTNITIDGGWSIKGI